jgi:hypothetical protein
MSRRQHENFTGHFMWIYSSKSVAFDGNLKIVTGPQA